MDAKSRKNTTAITVAVLVALVIIVAGATVLLKPKSTDTTKSNAAADTNQPATSAKTTASAPSNTSTATTATALKDGTYEATGNYRTPETRESVKVTLTVKDSVVTDVNEVSSATTRESAEWQARFESGYKQYVVGKPLSDVSLARVSGSSLTSEGFNAAIEDIVNQARA